MPTPTSLAYDASNGIWDWGYRGSTASARYAAVTGLSRTNLGRLTSLVWSINGTHSYDVAAITALWIHYANTTHSD